MASLQFAAPAPTLGRYRGKPRKIKRPPPLVVASAPVAAPVVVQVKKPKTKKIRKNPPKPISSSPMVNSENFFTNMLDPKHAFVLPRVVPTEVAPHYYTTTLSIPAPPAGQKSGAIMVQPSLTTPLAYLKLQNTGAGFKRDGINKYHHIQSNFQNTDIDFDEPLAQYGGDKTILSSALKNGFSYDQDKSKVIEQGAYFHAETWSVTTNAGFQIRNNGPFQISVYAYTQSVYEGGSRSASVAGTVVNIGAGATASVPFAANSSAVNSIGIAFGFCAYPTSAGNTQNSLSLDVTLFGVITMDEYWGWERMDFFANEDEGSAALADFQLAQMYCVNGFSVLFSNNANSLKAGGTAKACQLPGGSRSQIPGTPDNVFTWVANRATRRKMSNTQLKKGGFWTYRHEKIQDFMFRQHVDADNDFLYGDKNLPYGMFAYQFTDDDSQPQLSITINIALEYITNSNVAPKWMSPCDTTRLLELWISLGSEESNWSENPDHVDKIKEWTRNIYKRTLGNPQFRSAALATGGALAKLAITAL